MTWLVLPAFILIGCDSNLGQNAGRLTTLKVGSGLFGSKEVTEEKAGAYLGGSPGDVTIRGILVSATPSSVTVGNSSSTLTTPPNSVSTSTATSNLLPPYILNRHISTTLVPGKGNSLPKVEDHRHLSPAIDSNLTALAFQSTQYLNLGCTVQPDEVKGLEKLEDDDIDSDQFSYTVRKVFICNALGIKETILHLVAYEMILNNAKINLEATTGSVSLVTNRLQLIGSNIISTAGASAESYVPPAPAIELSVLEKFTAGRRDTLEIKSTGGNCTHQKPAPAPAWQPPSRLKGSARPNPSSGRVISPLNPSSNGGLPVMPGATPRGVSPNNFPPIPGR